MNGVTGGRGEAGAGANQRIFSSSFHNLASWDASSEAEAPSRRRGRLLVTAIFTRHHSGREANPTLTFTAASAASELLRRHLNHGKSRSGFMR